MIDYTGQQIGSYRLVRRLGMGGFASVYLGKHVRIATQQAAIKLLHLFDVDVKKFQQEAETMAALVHPHIIRLFDFDFHDQMPFLVIEYAPGGSLRTRYPEGIQVPLPNVVQYVQQIAEALEYAHSKNIIHRDIKPDNILIGMQGELRLSDFGIAVLSQTGRTSLGVSSGVGGTAYYMAPEQSRGKPEKASDQYALAIMVYEWLCGKPPFTEGNAINIQYQHAYEPIPPLSEQLPTLPPAVEQVIMRALTRDPKGRFASVKDFAQALKIACSDTAPASIHSLPPIPSPNAFREVPPAGGNSKKHISDEIDDHLSSISGDGTAPQTGPSQAQQAIHHQPTDKLPGALSGVVAAIPVRPPITQILPVSSQQSDTGEMSLIAGASAASSVGRNASISYPPVLSSKSAQTGTTRKRPGSRGLTVVVSIIGVLLICNGIISCVSGQQLFGFGLFANGNTTITIMPNSKIEQDSYVIQAVTSNADLTKRQISLRQLTFSPPKQSKLVTATGVSQTGAARASGTLVFSNGSGNDFPVQAGTRIQSSHGIEVTTDQFVDIPAGNPLNSFVATVSVPAHAADPGTDGNIGVLTIDQFCCASGNTISVKNPNAFSGGKDAKDYPYLRQSDVDGVVNQLKPTLSQQAQNALKGQIKPHEQLVNDPQCTTQSNVDQPIGDQGQKVTTANITVNATCTGLAYDTGGAQTLAQSLLTRKAASDLGPNYVLTGTIMTKQVVTDVQDSIVTLQAEVAGTWYYQFDDNQKQTLAKQLANKSLAAAQSMLKNNRGIAKTKIDSANGDTLPADPEQMSIRVLEVSGASPSDLPALPTVATGGRE